MNKFEINDLRRPHQPAPEPSFLARLPWVPIIFVVIIAAVVAGCYYEFYWLYRLPQERVLKVQGGDAIQARIEACGNDVVKYTLLTDNTIRYLPITRLASPDEEFVQNLPKTIALTYPLDYIFEDAAGKSGPVRIEGRNSDWVKYTLLSDHSTHYIPLTALSANDQAVVSQLSSYLVPDYPMDLVMTNQEGQSLAGRVDGRSDEVVKLTSPDGTILLYPFAELSSLDQKLVRTLPTNLSLRFPFECTLTDIGGKKLNVRLEGRSANTIKYTQLGDGLTYYTPVSDFSPVDQKVLRLLPSDMTFIFPFEYTLTDMAGKPMRVRLEGRTTNIVKFTLLSDGLQYYFPLTSFTADDQKFLKLLPADLRIVFPLDYTLTAQSGQTLEAHIDGRNADTVKFELSDGKTYAYPIAKLSDASQTFLRLIPANMIDADLPSSASAPPPASPPGKSLLTGLRDRLSALVKEDEQLQRQMDDTRSGRYTSSPTASNGLTTTGSSINGGSGSVNASTANPERVQLQTRMDSNRSEIESICKQINSAFAESSKPKMSVTVQGWWDEVTVIIREDDSVQSQIANSGNAERQPLIDQLRGRQKSLESALEKINGETGSYCP